MKKHIILLIDNSYSMKTNSEGIIKGLNSFIDRMKKGKQKIEDIFFSVMFFSDTHDYLLKAIPLTNVPFFTTGQLPKYGLTFLYDAIGIIMEEWLPFSSISENYLFIITDGSDTGSVRVKSFESRLMCEDAVKKGWKITHCGVDSGNLGNGVLDVVGEIDDLEKLIGGICI